MVLTFCQDKIAKFFGLTSLYVKKMFNLHLYIHLEYFFLFHHNSVSASCHCCGCVGLPVLARWCCCGCGCGGGACSVQAALAFCCDDWPKEEIFGDCAVVAC